ncbi:MAG: class I SAM-dependent methyltransferase [Actinomycetes bacterium]
MKESERFVSTHLGDYPSAPAWLLDPPALAVSSISSVLDVGCGPATFLQSVVNHFGANTGAGVEPSPEAVRLLDEHYAGDPRLSFHSGLAHSLPFETDQFDLVVCWSVLHWVGRNEYLQAVGELIRVTGKHLVIMDFVAGEDYRVEYHHDSRFFTYKMDFTRPVLASGVMSLVADRRWWEGADGVSPEILDPSRLTPFAANPLSYVARRACVFDKDYETLPLLTAGDFAG